MKISFDIDCTPEEARSFFGLMDVKPLQAILQKEMEAKMLASLKNMDPEQIIKNWMGSGFGKAGMDNNPIMDKLAALAPSMEMSQQGLEQMQNFWTQVMQHNAPKSNPSDKS